MAGNKTSQKKGAGWGSLGGNGKMHSFRGVGTQKPASSSQEGSGGRRDQKVSPGGQVGFYSSGTGNKSYAGTQTPGTSGQNPSGGNDKFAKGGSTKMWGHSGSQRAEAGKSSAR